MIIVGGMIIGGFYHSLIFGRIPTSCAAEEGMTTTAGTIIGGAMTIGIAGDVEGQV
jgi:hypothetical protein